MASKKAFASSPFEDPERVSRLSEANTSFALDVYRCLRDGHSNNLFFSPASMSTALAMTFLGARKNTSKEMCQVLKFTNMDPEEAHGGFADLLRVLNSADAPYVLKMANKLFARQNYKFLESFLADTRKFYMAEAELADFAGDSEGSRQKINKWVEDQTAQKIKDLMPEGSINGLTAMVLVNAIYFKGDWENKFEQSRTKRAPFFISADVSKEVDMMFISEDFKAGFDKELGCKVLELPYVKKDLSMFVVLPKKPEGLHELEDKLSTDVLHRLTTKMRKIKVHCCLPRFKLEYSCSLNDTLVSLGMNDLFTGGQCDLSGMDGTKELYVSAAVHKAFIEVNEEGSEAAAATGMVMNLMCMPETMEFKANHPFLFFIRENNSETVLFLGRYCSPPDV